MGNEIDLEFELYIQQGINLIKTKPKYLELHYSNIYTEDDFSKIKFFEIYDTRGNLILSLIRNIQDYTLSSNINVFNSPNVRLNTNVDNINDYKVVIHNFINQLNDKIRATNISMGVLFDLQRCLLWR